MATCGLPDCRSAVSDKSQGDTPFKGPCGLPDCRNATAGAPRGHPSGQPSSSRARPVPGEQSCGLPGCMSPSAAAAGKEICLYRRRNTSVLGRITDAYKLFWTVCNKIQTDPFYWSLFKAGVYFLLGLKLFRDLAIEFRATAIPKCGKRRR